MAKSIMKRPAERKPAKDDVIGDFLADRAGQVQRLEYEALGRLIQLQTRDGWLQFRRNEGPTIGRLHDGSIELLDPWPGLRDKIEATQELCPDCLADCDECAGTGKRLCKQCGGANAVKTAEKPCECVEQTGTFDPGCKQCRGGGSLAVMSPCPTCAGEGQMTCPECLGTKKMSTGHLNGALPTRRGPICQTCEGYGKKLNRTSQDLEPHVVHDQADYLGPILSFLIKPVGEQREPEPWTCSADAGGRHLYLLSSENFAPGTRASFLGGIPVPHPIQSL